MPFLSSDEEAPPDPGIMSNAAVVVDDDDYVDPDIDVDGDTALQQQEASNATVSIASTDDAQAEVARHRLQPQLVKPAWCSKAHGKVSQVHCWMNSRGIITGIQLTDDVGVRQPGICGTAGAHAGGGLLGEYESIVEIRACK